MLPRAAIIIGHASGAQLDLSLIPIYMFIRDSSNLWLCEHGYPVDWHSRLQQPPSEANLDHLTAHLLDTHLPHAVVIDCSASDLSLIHI